MTRLICSGYSLTDHMTARPLVWGPTLPKHTPAGDEQGIDIWGLSFNITFSKSERPACAGCDFVHVSLPAEVTGYIPQPGCQVPGTADSPQDRTVYTVSGEERWRMTLLYSGPLSGHILSILQCLKSVKVPV